MRSAVRRQSSEAGIKVKVASPPSGGFRDPNLGPVAEDLRQRGSSVLFCFLSHHRNIGDDGVTDVPLDRSQEFTMNGVDLAQIKVRTTSLGDDFIVIGATRTL